LRSPGRGASLLAMKRLKHFLLWTLLFVALLVVADQLLMQTTLSAPGVGQFQRFYRDFRGRLFALIDGPAPASIDQVIETAAPPARQAPGARPVTPQRYLYVDGQGELQFADSLQEVPPAFRQKAQPLQE